LRVAERLDVRPVDSISQRSESRMAGSSSTTKTTGAGDTFTRRLPRSEVKRKVAARARRRRRPEPPPCASTIVRLIDSPRRALGLRGEERLEEPRGDVGG
jgi:hypothetical protein